MASVTAQLVISIDKQDGTKPQPYITYLTRDQVTFILDWLVGNRHGLGVGRVEKDRQNAGK